MFFHGDTILSTEQLLNAWNTFLRVTFSEPGRDKTANKKAQWARTTKSQLMNWNNASMVWEKALGIKDIPIEADIQIKSYSQ